MRFYRPRQPHAYGARRLRIYVDDAQAIPAADLSDDEGFHFTAQPMPNGGIRRYVRCPNCASPVTSLYASGLTMRCRACLGLRYRSQYAGRRPEADSARLDTLLDAATATRNPATRARRLARWDRAYAAYDAHQEDYHRRYTNRHTMIMTYVAVMHAWVECLEGQPIETEAGTRARHAAYMRAWRAKKRGGCVLPFPAHRLRIGAILAEMQWQRVA